MAAPGRNDACPCGSGRKYKKCCALTAAPRRPDAGASLSALLTAGRHRELEAAAAALVAENPGNGLAWKALGVAQRLLGKESISASRRATALLPADAEAHSNLGHVLLDAGQASAAIEQYRIALRLNPGFADVHNNLAAALRSSGALTEAVDSSRRALSLQPRSAAAHYNLGAALRGLGRLPEALASLRRAVELKPDFAAAYADLSVALRRTGQLAEAGQACRRLLELRPADAGAHINLGNVLQDGGRLADALASYRRALELDPSSAIACHNIGSVLRDQGQFDEAATAYRCALDLDPSLVDAHVNLGVVLRSVGRADEAAACGHRALELNPRASASLTLLGELQLDAGEFDRAEALFRQAIDIDPHATQAWASLSRLRRMTPADSDWVERAGQLVERGLAPRSEAPLQFALGKFRDDLGQFARAFGHYRRANELVRSFRSRHYDAALTRRTVDDLIQYYDRRAIEGLRSAEPPQLPRVVLIVGMPRSGTSLAEQILASHPAAVGAGELTFWNEAAASLAGRGGAHPAPADVAQSGRQYRQHLRALAAQAHCVIDKMPGNYRHLGLIHAAVPDARIIHLRRDPRDTCLSIYFQYFESAHEYANDLGDLRDYYGEYRRLMRHWRDVLPEETVLDLDYEALVTDPATWIPRIVAFAGLPWDDACLSFHETRRRVATESRWQVRQPLHGSSVGRWRNYADQLDALRGLDEAP